MVKGILRVVNCREGQNVFVKRIMYSALCGESVSIYSKMWFTRVKGWSQEELHKVYED